jgi:RNA polymerase sigma-70 factor, ECF subfamily
LPASSQQADERLLIEAAQKDPACFAELYERNFARVYAFVSRRIATREEAQDVTAEVFHQALAKIAQFEWRGLPFAAWLYRIASNALADRWSRARQDVNRTIRDEETRDRGGPSAYASLEEIEQRALLFRLVEALPKDQKRVVEARFAEQKSIREIAQEMRKSEGAIKQLQFRALESLRARLGVTHG